jgi:hypothetical protein
MDDPLNPSSHFRQRPRQIDGKRSFAVVDVGMNFIEEVVDKSRVQLGKDWARR